MGFRVGKRVGNTYVSTNGRNVRVTTKLAKGVYHVGQFGHKRNRATKSLASLFSVSMIFIILYFTFEIIATNTMGISFNVILGNIFSSLPKGMQQWILIIGICAVLYPPVMYLVLVWTFKGGRSWVDIAMKEREIKNNKKR